MLSSPSAPKCFYCDQPLEFPRGNVGREQMCPHCSSDVHVCLNCRHYDPIAYNECREPMAERVVDKDRRNFCDYFYLEGAGRVKTTDSKEAAFKKLDELFKK
jgi:hypothetical protein